MKIDRNYQLDKAVSKDELRPALQHILLEKEFAIATDGHILAKVPIENNELAGLLTPKALVTARKMQKTPDLDIRLISNTAVIIKMDKNGAHDTSETVELKRCELDEDGSEPQYPNWKSVISKHQNPFKFGFDLQNLVNLAQAMGTDKVVLQIDTAAPHTSIIVYPFDLGNRSKGLLMPMRINHHLEENNSENR
jgi:hypothetical protein